MNQNYQFPQSSFLSLTSNNQPNDEVNWAQLAQRWIYAHQQQQQQRQAYLSPPPPVPNTASGGYLHPPTPLQPQSTQPRYSPNYNQPPVPIAQPNIQPLFSSTGHRHPGYFPTPPSFQQQPSHLPPNQWASRPTFPPLTNMGYPPQYPPSAIPANSLPLIQYPLPQNSEAKQEEEYRAHYDPSLADDSADTEQSPQQEIDSNAPPEGAMGHWMINNMWATTTQAYPNNYMPVIDMQMRKKLPSWILEGLEKAEKEKQKKLEKEEMERKQKELQEERRRKREQKGLGKFDSDSEDEEIEIGDKQNEQKTIIKNSPIQHFREFIEDNKEEENGKDERSLEERRQEAILLMRRLITTVLLNATNHEFDRIAEECIAIAKNSNKAQPKILAKSSALAMLSSLGDEDEEDDTSSIDDGMNSPKSNSNQRITAASPVHNKEEKTSTKDSQLVFKVPLAPSPKSVKPNQCEEAKEAKKEDDKQRSKKSKNQEKERPAKYKQNEKHGRRETDEYKLNDDNLPSHYRSSNGKDKKWERSRDRERERDWSRERNRDRNRDDRRREDRNKSGERVKDKNRRRQSRSPNRSPRDRRHLSRSYRDRSRSPRR